MTYRPVNPWLRIALFLGKLAHRKGRTAQQNSEVRQLKIRLFSLYKSLLNSQYRSEILLPSVLPIAFSFLPKEYRTNYELPTLGIMRLDSALNELSLSEIHFLSSDISKFIKRKEILQDVEEALFLSSFSLLVDCKVSRRELSYDIEMKGRLIQEIESACLQMFYCNEVSAFRDFYLSLKREISDD
nr:hypothetical protein [uncultured Cohaesibacter sp.]